MMDIIDFVITWVNGDDPAWQKEHNHYAKFAENPDISPYRYRDWGFLKYWFRGVETFAPWVNNIYFVTCGHIPTWLNINHPKLKIVKHTDFIPAEYLPTFNSNVIEFYLHKINGLSERFVYFNDDTLIIDTVKPTRFFKDGLPRDIGGLKSANNRGVFGTNVYLSRMLINDNFNKKKVINQSFHKWFNYHYPLVSLKNLLYYFVSGKEFVGFIDPHLSQPFLKETFIDVWGNCKDDLLRTSHSRIRQYGDIAFWLMRYWQLASGRFAPYNPNKDGIYYELRDDYIPEIVQCIREKRKAIICLNDTESVSGFEKKKEEILVVLSGILPKQSAFER